MLAAAKKGDRRKANCPHCFASEFSFYDNDWQASLVAFGNCIVVAIGQYVCLYFLKLAFVVGGILVNGREVLPNVLGARLVITVDNDNFLANSIPIRECIVSRITLWLFPSHHWS